MNSIWNKNFELLKDRFPLLVEYLKEELELFTKNNFLVNDFFTETSKSGIFTARYNNIYLHSKYDPLKEASRLTDDFDSSKNQTAVFFGFGLGYGPVEFCKKNKDSLLVIIEKNPQVFFAAMTILDWSSVFEQQKLILLIGDCLNQIPAVFDKIDYSQIYFFKNANQINHQNEYINEVENQIKTLKQKKEINNRTLEKFAHLWLTNSIKNLNYLRDLDGVNRYFLKGTNIPFVILAAGPSLNRIIPYLAELKKRAVLICVDTALHALLKAGVEPDFIILVDPQFDCAMHLEFLKSPSSILIAESAVWPSVFRFECKEKILCSSMYPIGQYFEKRLGTKGCLGAGGSVTTTAWDFARKCGALEIFLAGMDLGFPNKETHIKGSQFEEKAHKNSTKINPSETFGIYSLMSAPLALQKDYCGNDLLTDSRMNLFSWWFEQSCQKAELDGQKTYSLTFESLAIKGIEPFSLKDFLQKDEITQEKETFLNQKTSNTNHETFTNVISSFAKDIETISLLSEQAVSICNKAIKTKTMNPNFLKELADIDNQILNSPVKETAALIFPTQSQLSKILDNIQCSPQEIPVYNSKTIYELLTKNCTEILNLLNKNFY